MDSKFSDYLLEKMSERDWNESQLARKIGVHRGTVNRWLKEAKLPELGNMKKIAEGLGVSLQEVVNAVEGKYKPLSRFEREAMEILNRYQPESIKLAVEKLS